MDFKKTAEAKKKLLTISELSKLSNVKIQSIRYYEEKGILKPTLIDKVTKYRYYSKEQSYVVQTIKFCIEIGITLAEMKKYIKKDELDYLELILYAKNIAEEKITKMQKGFFEQTLIEEKISRIRKVELDKIYTKKIPAKNFKLTTYKKEGYDKIGFYTPKEMNIFNLEELTENKEEADFSLSPSSSMFIHSRTKTIDDVTKIFKEYINLEEPFIAMETSVITATIKPEKPIREICVIIDDNL